MSLCARNRCRNRYLPNDDTVDIKDLPNHFEVQYILECGHSLCEKCLYMIVQSDERSFICDQCKGKTTFSARAFASIKGGKLSNDEKLNRLNADFTGEMSIDAYSFGLAFNEGHLLASPVETVTSPDEPTMEETFKYSKSAQDEDNLKLKGLIPSVRRNRTIALTTTMHQAIATHAECGSSLKVLGNLEKKLFKEFYEAKMRLREQFQFLHSLLQLEELKGLNKFEEIYKKRKDEFSQVEKHLHSIRRSISDTFQLEHDTMDLILRKRNKLREFIAKPSRISWRNYEIADEFNFQLDDYLKEVIKDSLKLKNIEKATTLVIEVVNPEVKTYRDPLPLFRPPSHLRQIPAPGTSSSSSDLQKSIEEPKDYSISSPVIKDKRLIEVKLSNVYNPDFFYVINWENENRIRKMADQIENWCTRTYTHPPPLSTLKPGNFIFVFYDSVARWVRARILVINSDPEKAYRKRTEFGKSIPSAYSYYSSVSIDVQLLDYGGHLNVPFNKLRQPFDEFFDTEVWPYLALKCALWKTYPKYDKWTPEAKEFLDSYGRDYILLCRIHSIEGDLHYVNLVYKQAPIGVHNNLSVRELLVGSRLAVALDFDNMRDLSDFDPFSETIHFPGSQRIEITRTENVLITAITNPDLFYVTRYANQDKFLELHESLKIYFEMDDAPSIVHQPRKGLPCVGLDGGAFYRAEITKLLDGTQVEVQFVDFGTTKILDIASLRLIREDFLRIPIHAIPCKLADVGPIKFVWDDETIAKFQELCFGGPLGNSFLCNLAVINYDKKGKHIVNLRRFTGNQFMSVNVALVTLGCARSTGPITETPTDSAMLSPYDNKLDDRIFIALEDFDVSGYAILKELITRNREAEASRIDSYIKIRISHWTSPNEFYIQLTSPEVRSYFVCYENKLVDEYHSKLGDSVPQLQPKLEENEPVIFAQVEEYDVIWRRGIIVKRETIDNEIIGIVKDENGLDCEVKQDKPSTKYKLLARDFGYTIEVARKHIFKLPVGSTYLKDGDFCIKCHLYGVVPAGGGNWTQTAIEGFGELVKKYQYDLLIDIPEKRFPSEPTQSVPVDVLARNDYIADGLAIVEEKFYSFRSLMITQGLAIPVTKINLSDPNDVGFPSDENFPVKRSLFPYTNRKGDTVLGYIRNARAAVQRQMDNTVVRFYKEPEKPDEQTFIALPTEVGLDLKVWFRITKLQGPQLINVINRSITNTLKDQDQLLPFAGDFIFGRACTAFFSFDQTWNRAEVLYPLGDDRVFVRFVDYGNEVPVTKEELSSQVFHPEIPKLALNGILANCKSNAQGRDAENLQTQIHNLIIDHKCVFKWINFKSLKEMRLSIIMPDGVDLVDFLIKNNHFVVEALTDDQTLVSVPPMVLEIFEKLPICGYKPSTLKFEENSYYPVIITGTFRESYTFIQPKPIPYPANEIEDEIELRSKEFLKSLQSMRAEAERFEKAEKFNPGEAVAAKFSDDQWYRGLILEKSSSIFGNHFRVFYVDYGNTSVVEAAKIRKLPMKYRESPELFAIPARACNIKPGNHLGKWSPNLLDLMEYEISANEHNTTALIKSRTDPWNIEIYISDPKDPRVPVSSLWEPLFKSGQLIEIKSDAKKQIN